MKAQEFNCYCCHHLRFLVWLCTACVGSLSQFPHLLNRNTITCPSLNGVERKMCSAWQNMAVTILWGIAGEQWQILLWKYSLKLFSNLKPCLKSVTFDIFFMIFRPVLWTSILSTAALLMELMFQILMCAICIYYSRRKGKPLSLWSCVYANSIVMGWNLLSLIAVQGSEVNLKGHHLY